MKLTSLNRLNLAMAALHFGQGVAVVAFGRDFTVPVTVAYLKFNPLTQGLEPASQTLFHLSLPWLIASFFFLSAAAHLIVATVYRRRYEADLNLGLNRVRWIEYALSASTMMVAIALLVGVYDAGTLLAIFTLTAVMNLCGLMMEVHNQTTRHTNWLSYWVGCLAGVAPWAVIGLYFWASAHNGSAPPTFVYWIYVSLFIFFNCFALNMALQYRRVGRWRDYWYGERAYMVLSLVAKSLLAWQVFAGTLRPN
ncbi:MAG TPA: heliorhodopsin HeR [Candidatus Saccharimonadia bacterium]|nr:heliorhodopsin HeR [Candidatus Saccharimonadia bacterium]